MTRATLTLARQVAVASARRGGDLNEQRETKASESDLEALDEAEDQPAGWAHRSGRPMTFLILAQDFSDPDALSRRMHQRPAHIDGVRRMKAEGTFLDGGAILDQEGRMVGSMILVEFPSRSEVDEWLGRDPYVTGQVWEHITVRPFRRVQL